MQAEFHQMDIESKGYDNFMASSEVELKEVQDKAAGLDRSLEGSKKQLEDSEVRRNE